MKRREAIVSSVSLLLASGAYSKISPSALGLNFDVDSPSLNPSDINAILIDIRDFKLIPRYLDEQKDLRVEVEASLEDKYTNSISQEFTINNGESLDLSNSKVSRIVLDGIQEDVVSVSGEIKINIEGNEFSQTNRREFVISGENVPDGAVGIEDWYDFNEIRNDLSGDYVQLNDLDSQTAGYSEIASSSANNGLGFRPLSDTNTRFTGSYNGKGYRLEDMYIEEDGSNTTRGKVSIFGTVGSGSVVKNLVINNVELIKKTDVNDCGIIAASLQSGIIKDCYVNGSIDYIGSSGGSFHYGLIVGNCYGNVTRCSTSGSVYGDQQAGGIVGNTSTQASFTDCKTTASVSGEGDKMHTFHGDDNIDDDSKLDFTRCFTTGTAKGTKFSNGQGTYTDCFHDSSSSGHSSNVSAVTDLSTSQMQGSSAESNLSGFDFNNVWELVDGEYPILRTIPRDIQV